MKVFIYSLAFILAISSAFAASQAQINRKATQLLKKNVGSLTFESQDLGVTRGTMIRYLLHEKASISTRCVFDRNDALFNCTTTAIVNEGGEESAAIYQYQLEGNRNQLPTGFFFMNVKVSLAG